MKSIKKINLLLNEKELQLLYYSVALALQSCQELVRPRVREMLDKLDKEQQKSF